MNAGLHCADWHHAGARGLAIGKAGSTDHCHSVTLNRWQLLDRLATFLQLNTIELLWWRGHHKRMIAVNVFDFALALAILCVELIAKDGEKPSLQRIAARARLERGEIGERTHHRFLRSEEHTSELQSRQYLVC